MTLVRIGTENLHSIRPRAEWVVDWIEPGRCRGDPEAGDMQSHVLC